VASEPFVNQMRRGNVHVKASRKTFKNIYARFHTCHRMGATQERAACFDATLFVVTRHPGGPPGRPKIHPVFPRFALFFIIFYDSMSDLKKDSIISEYYVRGRKRRVSIFFLLQSFYNTPKIIRQNMNYCIILKLGEIGI
jgi:hypothetical protein